jgi:hypothetical protein
MYGVATLSVGVCAGLQMRMTVLVSGIVCQRRLRASPPDRRCDECALHLLALVQGSLGRCERGIPVMATIWHPGTI